VPERWVVNASPLICLAKAEHLDLLTRLADEVLLPPAVIREVLAGPASDPARQALQHRWGKPTPPVLPVPTVLEWGLGPGETEVITVAYQSPGTVAVLDDAEGRACARTLGVPLIGTLGVILKARKKGLIRSAGEVLNALSSSGLHLDKEIIREALKRSTGEEWR
jgi:predicted nucleic acid-binding protein